MKKIIIKAISVSLTLVFIFSMSISVYAMVETKEDINNSIIEALQAAEFVKGKMGLADINFEDFDISENPIDTYIYMKDGFEKKYEFYPLFIDNELTAFAIKNGNGSNCVYQITTDLVSEILLNGGLLNSVAIVYDDDCCYLYNGNELLFLSSFISYDANRSDIFKNIEEVDFSEIGVTNIGKIESIGYTKANITRIPIYYECDIDYVPQEYTFLCWAACISSIVAYITNSIPDSAETVARFHYGDDFNHTLPRGEAATVLGYYGVNYSVCNTVPSGSAILRNIKNGYPIYAGFTSSGVGHAGVLYGIHVTSSIYYIMDPAYGFVSATYKNGVGYTYVHSTSSNEFVFNYAVCKYLTV